MYIPNVSGNFTLTLPIDFFNLQLEEVKISVDTSAVPCNITLPSINSMAGFLNLKVSVHDFSGNAVVNNITVFAAGADEIDDAASVTINTNDGSVELAIVDLNDWATSGGTAGGGNPLIVGTLDVANTIAGGAFAADVPYPAATAGQAYRMTISVGTQDKGLIGGVAGAAGRQVESEDIIYALVDNAGGTQAAVGASWTIWEGEDLQLWENGTATTANSMRQIQLVDPNTADGVSAVVKGQGNSVTGGATAVNNDVGGDSNSVNGTNANGANNNSVTGELNSIVDTAAAANQNNVSGQSNTLASSTANSVSGVSNTITEGLRNNVTGQLNAVTGSTNGAIDNSVSGNNNTVTDNVASSVDASIMSGTANTLSGGEANIISGNDQTVTDCNNNKVVGQSNTLTGTTNGCDSNSVNGESNILIDTALAVDKNSVSGELNTLTGSSSNIISGNTNAMTSGLNNIATGAENTITGSTNGADNNAISGDTNIIIDTTAASNNNAVVGMTNTLNSVSQTTVSGTEAEAVRSNTKVLASGSTAAVGDNQTEWVHLKVSTTDATADVEMLNAGVSLGLPTGVAWVMTVKVLGVDLGTGVAGTAGDVTSYTVTATARNIAGTVTVVNKLGELTGQTTLLGAVDVQPNGGGTDVIVAVTGVVNRNVSWGASVKITQVKFV